MGAPVGGARVCSWPRGRSPPLPALLTGVPKGIFLKVTSDPISPPLRSFLCTWISQKDQVGQRPGIPGWATAGAKVWAWPARGPRRSPGAAGPRGLRQGAGLCPEALEVEAEGFGSALVSEVFQAYKSNRDERLGPGASLRSNRRINLKAPVTALPQPSPGSCPRWRLTLRHCLAVRHLQLALSPKVIFRLPLRGTCRSGSLWGTEASSGGGSCTPVSGHTRGLPALLALNILPVPTWGPCWGPDPGKV